MMKRATDLQFIIGMFFSIVAVILLLDYFFQENPSGPLNLYTGLGFFVFGLFMIFFHTKKDPE